MKMSEINNNGDVTGFQPEEPPKKTPGMAIAALVLGIVALLLSCCYYLSVPCAVLALIFGILVLRKGPEGKGMAIAGIICGAVTLVLVLILIACMGLFAAGISESQELSAYWDALMG